MAQLNLESELLANSIGLLCCSQEFIYSGVVKSLCERLPFDTLGTTSLLTGNNGGFGLDMLSLYVITSDELKFATAVSAPLQGDLAGPLADAYAKAMGVLGEAPSLLLNSAPFLSHAGGDVILKHLAAASGNVPVFGGIPCDQHTDFHEAYTIHNGAHYRDCLVMGLIAGPVQPRFYLISISEDHIQRQRAVITASEGNLLKTVNNVPVTEYMSSLGLGPGAGIEASITVPFMVEHVDGGMPLARGVYTFTPEGYAVCGADMPVGATLALGLMDAEDILRSSARLIDSILADGGGKCRLLVSCVSRCLALGIDVEAEAARLHKGLQGGTPYHLCYAGGEFCPEYDNAGNTVNRFHNFTLIACVF